MTRDEAEAVIAAFLAAYGVRGGPALNENDLSGVRLVDAQLYFEYHPRAQALTCSAFIERFAEPLGPAVLEALRRKSTPRNTSGGDLDYQPVNRGLFLSRKYDRVVPAEAFLAEMHRLADAARDWENRILDTVLLSEDGPGPLPPQVPLSGDS